MVPNDSFSAKSVTPISLDESRFSSIKLRCPHCSNTLVPKKNRKYFVIHKYVNPKCPYYLHNLKKVDKQDLKQDYGKNKYKLHYIYREFQIDFFRMDLNSLPKNASSLKFSKHNQHVMSLCLTYRSISDYPSAKLHRPLKISMGLPSPISRLPTTAKLPPSA